MGNGAKMKHIDFEQSTVMNEFARIASEQGLIKIAQDVPQPRGEITQPTPGQSVSPPEIERLPAGYGDVPLSPKDKPATGADVVKALSTTRFARHPGFKLLSTVLSGGKAPANQRTAQQLITAAALAMPELAMNHPEQVNSYLDAMKKSLETYLKQSFGNRVDTEQALQFLSTYNKAEDGESADDGHEVIAAKKLPCGCKPGGCMNNDKCECSKKCACKKSKKKEAADSKLYDVSGETGEQLVDKAHPGGGTKTELTHSKTDENLVETIVEQQEADVDVATSVPKGTYAELKGLYNVLSKMGYAEHLDGLRELLTITGSPEEILSDTLVTLADRLDRLGYSKYADQVDSLLKKKVITAADQSVEQKRKQIMQAIKSVNPPPGEAYMHGRLYEMVQNTDADSVDQLMTNMLGVGQYAAGSGTQIGTYVDNLLSNQIKNYQQTSSEPSSSMIAGQRPSRKQQRLWNSQNRLRTLVGLQPKQTSPFDRQLANVLRTKYPEAWKVVQQKGSLRQVFDAIRQQNIPQLPPTPQKAPPAPPPPPAPLSGQLAPPAMPQARMSVTPGQQPTKPTSQTGGQRQRPMTYQEQSQKTNEMLQRKQRELQEAIRRRHQGR